MHVNLLYVVQMVVNLNELGIIWCLPSEVHPNNHHWLFGGCTSLAESGFSAVK